MNLETFGPVRNGSKPMSGRPKRVHATAAHVFDRIGPDGEQPGRRALEAGWFANIAYFAGYQNLLQVDGRLRAPKKRRSEYTVNLTLGKVLRAVSKLLQMNARFAAAPLDDSLEARHASRVSERIFQYVRNEAKYRSKLNRALLWAAQCGSGYLKTTWNPRAGTPTRVYLEGGRPSLEVHMDPERRRQADLAGEYRDTYPGDVEIDVTPPFQLYWDQNTTDEGFEGSEWAAQVHVDSLARLRRTYGNVVEDSAAMLSGAHGSELYEEQIRFISAGAFGPELSGSSGSTGDPRARVIEYFERPNEENRQRGRRILLVGGVVVEDGDNPFVRTGGWCPFTKIDWFPMSGRWNGLSLVEQLRGSQRAHNRARALAIQWQGTSGYAPAYFQKGSGVFQRKQSGGVGSVFEYNSSRGAPPVFGPAPQMPPYIAQNADIAKSEMNEIAAQADPASSSLPGQLRSGRAVGLMQEDNNLILTPTSDSILSATQDVGTKVLELVSSYYDEPRTVRVVGEDGEWEVERFSGLELRGQTKVQVVGEPSRFETSESFKDDILEYTQAGALNPADPRDRKLILRSLDDKSSELALNRLLRQERDEERIIQRMIQVREYAPPTMPWQNPAIRAEILEDFLNSRQFESLDGFAQEKLARRWSEFTQTMQRQVQEQLQAESMTRGSAGEKGVASQPKRG